MSDLLCSIGWGVVGGLMFSVPFYSFLICRLLVKRGRKLDVERNKYHSLQ